MLALLHEQTLRFLLPNMLTNTLFFKVNRIKINRIKKYKKSLEINLNVNLVFSNKLEMLEPLNTINVC